MSERMHISNLSPLQCLAPVEYPREVLEIFAHARGAAAIDEVREAIECHDAVIASHLSVLATGGTRDTAPLLELVRRRNVYAGRLRSLRGILGVRTHDPLLDSTPALS